MLTLAPHSSASLRNHSKLGFVRRPCRYCLMPFVVMPNLRATSATGSPDLEMRTSNSLPMARSSHTTGVRGAVERKVGRALLDGNGTGAMRSDGGLFRSPGGRLEAARRSSEVISMSIIPHKDLPRRYRYAKMIPYHLIPGI